MRHLLHTFIVATVVTSLSFAATQDTSPDFEWASLTDSPRTTGVYHDDQVGDLWSRGLDYKANFTSDRVQFIPFLGADADRLYPLAWDLARVWSGGTELEASPDVQPVREEGSVLYTHQQWIEGYSIRDEGIEQWYRFEELPADGDLVIALDIRSDSGFDVKPFEGGLRFVGERGGVDFGKAKAFDGAGRAIPAFVDWTGEAIQIRVNGSDLEGAVLPITVDPLITTYAVDTFGTMLMKPDVAYDVSTNTVLVVYEEIYAGPDTDIFFRQYDADTKAVLHQQYLSVNTDDWKAPRVANNNYSDLFLVVFEIEASNSRMVSYRTISALDGSLGMVRGVSAIEFVYNYQPDAGGETFNGSGSYFLITWVEEDVMGDHRIVCTRVTSGGLCLFEDTTLAPYDSWSKQAPAVSNTAGSVGVFNLAWAAYEGAATTVRGARVSYSGAVVDTGYAIGSGPAVPSCRPAVSPSLTSGDPGHYLVVYESQFPTSPVSGMVGLNAVSMAGSVQAGSTQVDPNYLYEQTSDARVDSDGSRYVLTWNAIDPATGYDGRVMVSTMSSAGGNLCHSEIRIPVDPTNSMSDLIPVVVSEVSGAGTGSTTHLAWSREDTTIPDKSIYGADYEMHDQDCLGQIQLCTPTANSSGQAGRTWAYGSHIANDRLFELRADQLPTNQFGYFLTGTGVGGFVPPGSQGQLCLAGSLGRFNRGVAEVLHSGAAGEFGLSINTLDMPLSTVQVVSAGSTWYFQAWHRDLNPGQTSNFSTLLGVSFD